MVNSRFPEIFLYFNSATPVTAVRPPLHNNSRSFNNNTNNSNNHSSSPHNSSNNNPQKGMNRNPIKPEEPDTDEEEIYDDNDNMAGLNAYPW